MRGGRGAKGSINDRLISMMYRNRYQLEQRKKEYYTKEKKEEQKEYLQGIQYFDLEKDYSSLDKDEKKVIDDTFINSVSSSISNAQDEAIPFKTDFEKKLSSLKNKAIGIENSENLLASSHLHDLSNSVMDIELDRKVFDFSKYYYGVNFSDFPSDEVIDVENEIAKVEDEQIILTELSIFIEDSKVLVSEIKDELSEVQQLISQSQTQDQVTVLEKKYAIVREKVDKLKAQYDVIKEKYDFEDYKILESIPLIAAVEDYRDKASLEELEIMVDVCKEQIDQIDDILEEERKSIGIGKAVEQQKQEVQKRDEEFEQNRKGVIYLDDLEKKIAKAAREQEKMIFELEKKLQNFTTSVETVTQTVFHTERIFGSFIKVMLGILTVPFSGRHIFGTTVGTHLLNRGIHQLNDSLEPRIIEKQEVRHRYQDIGREILNSQDYVKDTAFLISDSLYQLEKFDEQFKNRFSEYTNLIPEYAELEKKIETLKKCLKQKQIEVQEMQKDLDRQYEENKVKVKKAS